MSCNSLIYLSGFSLNYLSVVAELFDRLAIGEAAIASVFRGLTVGLELA